MTADIDSEAQERYRLACARLERVREAWEAADCPMTALSPRGVLGQHPLLKELRAHEHLVDRLYVHAKRSRMGRPPTAVMDFEALGLPAPVEQKVRRIK
jgi:hypothetical protein